MPGRFRLTKSKSQILLFIQILSFHFPFPNFANFSKFFLPNFANFSKFFQFLQKFHFLPVFSFFSKFFLYPLIWFLPRAVVFFSEMIAAAPKFYCSSKFWQLFSAGIGAGNLTWAGAGHAKKFLKLENFSKYFQLGKELESWDCFSFKLPKISKFWKSWEFLLKWKKIEELENSGRAEICRERINKLYIPKKSSFFSPLIRSGPAQIFSFN